MTNILFIMFLGTPQLHHYTCTTEQLHKASEVFVPCKGEKHFNECYEASIFEYCEINFKGLR